MEHKHKYRYSHLCEVFVCVVYVGKNGHEDGKCNRHRKGLGRWQSLDMKRCELRCLDEIKYPKQARGNLRGCNWVDPEVIREEARFLRRHREYWDNIEVKYKYGEVKYRYPSPLTCSRCGKDRDTGFILSDLFFCDMCEKDLARESTHWHDYIDSARCMAYVCETCNHHKGMTRCYYGHLLIYKQWKDISWPDHLYGCGWADPYADETPLDKYLFDLARLRKFGDA